MQAEKWRTQKQKWNQNEAAFREQSALLLLYPYLPETDLFTGKMHFSGDHVCVAPGGRPVGSPLACEAPHVLLPQSGNSSIFVLKSKQKGHFPPFVSECNTAFKTSLTSRRMLMPKSLQAKEIHL